jgi:hypothetical protein
MDSHVFRRDWPTFSKYLEDESLLSRFFNSAALRSRVTEVLCPAFTSKLCSLIFNSLSLLQAKIDLSERLLFKVVHQAKMMEITITRKMLD